MNESSETAIAQTVSGLAPVLEPRLSLARRRVVCGGVKGILAFSDGRWGFDNEAELAVLEALGSPSVGVGRLRAITAELNSGAAGAGDVTCLNRCLRSIAETEPVWSACVPGHLMAAAAVACAHWDHPNAVQWLCWALSALLGRNLSEAGRVGPGRISFHHRTTWSRVCGHDRDTRWMRRVGDGFWERLASHEESVVREVSEASDPDTSAGRLEELLMSPHDEVLDLVASHPNTPDSTLLGLICHDPKGRFPPDALLQFRVAQNLALSSEVIASMLDNVSTRQDRVWYLLIHHPNISEKLLDQIASLYFSIGLIGWVASHPKTPGSTLEHILNSHSSHSVEEDDYVPDPWSGAVPAWKIRASAAANPAMTADLLARLAGDPCLGVRAAAAANSSTAVAELAKLAGDGRREVRAAAATNSKLPEALLEKLASDRCEGVRAAAAANPEMPQELLSQLAFDIHPRVRWMLTVREHTPDAVLDMLASDPDFPVRLFLARHPSAPRDALVRLAGDSDADVRWETADNPACPAEVLCWLAGDGDARVRGSVADHPSAPAAVLERLASDPELWVRESAAGNPSASTDVLTALAADPEFLVRSSVAGNPSAPHSALERLARREWASVFHPALEALAERRQPEGPNSATTT